MIRVETLSLMSDVELPVYVARAQVASAIHVIVQLSRFVEDGSRKITRITEAFGLDEANQYRLHELATLRVKGRSRNGMLQTELAPTGQSPTFAAELREQGLEGRAKLTGELWKE